MIHTDPFSGEQIIEWLTVGTKFDQKTYFNSNEFLEFYNDPEYK